MFLNDDEDDDDSDGNEPTSLLDQPSSGSFHARRRTDDPTRLAVACSLAG